MGGDEDYAKAVRRATPHDKRAEALGHLKHGRASASAKIGLAIRRAVGLS